MARVMNDSSLRKQLGCAAREAATQRFSVERMAAQTLEIYREVAGNRNNRNSSR
jgi:glycosyltransferase involved in cell wall biosynthesis